MDDFINKEKTELSLSNHHRLKELEKIFKKQDTKDLA